MHGLFNLSGSSGSIRDSDEINSVGHERII